jgi:SAM-dependent methyltransferase
MSPLRDRSLYDSPALYDALFPLSSQCVSFYSGLARTGRILELGCGTGLLATALAKTGNAVTGIDASASMLAAARERSAGAGVHVDWQEQDMRSFSAPHRYSLIIAARNSLLHLHTIDDFVRTFTAVRKHLTSDGVFAFDIFNPDVRLLARTPETVHPVMRIATADFGELSIEETFSYDAATQVGTSHWTIRGEQQWDVTLSLRSVFPQELPLLLYRGGLVLSDRYGDYDRGPFTSDSPRQVCIAKAH